MLYNFLFPDIGEGVHEGKVLKFNYKAGDIVEEGDILASVETDKVVADIPTPKSGKIISFGVEEGNIINVGEVFAKIQIESDSDLSDNKKEENAGVIGELELSDGTVLPSGEEGIYDENSVNDDKDNIKVLATPVARKMASDFGIDISKIKGTGVAGRVMKGDILKANEIKKEKNSSQKIEKIEKIDIKKDEIIKNSDKKIDSIDYDIIPLSTIRETISKNMEKSRDIPSALIQDFAIVDSLIKLRENINKDRDIRVSLQPFFIKAISAALKKYPQLNSNFDPIKKEILQFKTVNMGIAVDTKFGLMVPVIKNVEKKSIIEINNEMKKLVKEAKDRTITIDKLQGGSISLTNYGPFGGVYGYPMILPPQTAIIGFGRIHKKPIVKGDNIEIGTILPISLPFDHRVVDGATASLFITEIIKLLSNPEDLLISI